MLKKLILVLITFSSVLPAGPYAPPAGQPGSMAIYKDDITVWANSVVVERGFINIGEPVLGCVDYGSDANCLGHAEGEINGVVSLGDGGMATLGFQYPIT